MDSLSVFCTLLLQSTWTLCTCVCPVIFLCPLHVLHSPLCEPRLHVQEEAVTAFLQELSLHLGGPGAVHTTSAARASVTAAPADAAASQPAAAATAATASGVTGIVGDLRPHIITHVGSATRTATLMKDSLLEATPAKDRQFVRTFMETQMFQVSPAAVCGVVALLVLELLLGVQPAC